MSVYTDSMVVELTQAGAFDYAAASAFAEKHNLSTRSVISKIKSLGLAYEKKPVPAKSGVVRIRKADVVRVIATKLGLEDEALSGLGKADMGALQELLRVI